MLGIIARQLGGVESISLYRNVTAAALIGLIPAAEAQAQISPTPSALQELRRELDVLKADQLQRQDQIEALQRRLDAYQAGVGEAPVLDPATAAEIRGRGLSPPQKEPARVAMLQVGSYLSEAQAQAASAAFKAAHPELRGVASSIQRADLGAMGTRYRLLIGPFADFAAANATCDGLKAQGAGCLLGGVAVERSSPALTAQNAGVGAATPLAPSDEADIRGRGVAPRQMVAAAAPAMPNPAAAPTNAPAGGENDETVVREAAPARSVQATTEAQQGIFGDRLSFEVGFSYSHFDAARIDLSGFLALDAIFLGRISIDQTKGDVTTLDFAARYRLTPRLQFDIDVPVMARVSLYQSGGAGSSASALSEATRRAIGLADVSAGANYRLLSETIDHPDVVLSARVKAPTGRNPYGVPLVEVPGSGGNLKIPARLGTGSGTWGASIGASALKTIDPLIVFGNFSYFRNFQQSFPDISEAPGLQPGTVKPGDAFQYGAGVAFAVNDRSSLSFSFTQRFVEGTNLKNAGGRYVPIIGSSANVASLNIGTTFAFSQRASVIVNVGAGLTRDTPDFSLATRIPFAF